MVNATQLIYKWFKQIVSWLYNYNPNIRPQTPKKKILVDIIILTPFCSRGRWFRLWVCNGIIDTRLCTLRFNFRPRGGVFYRFKYQDMKLSPKTSKWSFLVTLFVTFALLNRRKKLSSELRSLAWKVKSMILWFVYLEN